MKKLSFAFTAAAALSASAFASDLNIQGLELTPMFSYALPEGNLDLRKQTGIGLRLGYTYEHIATELGYDYFKGKFDDAEQNRVRAERMFINALLPKRLGESKFDAYLMAGLGYEHFSQQLYDNHDGAFFHYGAGLKYKLDDNFALRAELRDQVKFRHQDHHLIGSLGLVYHWGHKAQPEPAVAPMPAPAVEPAPAPQPLQPKPARCYDLEQVNVYFDFDKSTIKAQYLEQIKTLAAHINEEPAYHAYVRGYTDNIGTSAYNQALSKRRAEAASAALQSAGVAPERINPSWYGFAEPIAANSTKDGRAQNRRVELKIVCE